MELATKNKMQIKTLIGLAKLTVDQVIKYLNHANYQLKGSKVVLIDNINIISGAYGQIFEGDLVSIEEKNKLGAKVSTSNWSQFMNENMVLIIFKKGEPAYAVYG